RGDGQTQAGPGDDLPGGGGRPVEALEDPPQVGGGDAHAGVGDREHGLAVRHAGRDLHAPPGPWAVTSREIPKVPMIWPASPAAASSWWKPRRPGARCRSPAPPGPRLACRSE